MASQATLELLMVMGAVSYRIGCVPFRVAVAPASGRVGAPLKIQLVDGTRAQKALWLTQNACNLSFIVVMYYVAGLWYELTQPVTMVESSQYYFLTSIFSFSLCCHVGVLLYSKRWRELANGLLRFNSKIYKLVGLDHSEPDGIEIYLRSLLLVIFGSSALVLPVMPALVLLRVHSFAIYQGSIWAAAGLALLCAYFVLLDWFIIVDIAVIALAYVNVVLRSMRVLRQRVFEEDISHEAAMLAFRAHVIFHAHAMSEFKHFTALAIGLASASMITTLYVVIGYYAQAGIMSLQALAVFCLILVMIQALMKFSTYITSSSQRLLSILGTFGRQWQDPTRLNAILVLRKQLRAARPMAVNIGIFGVIESKTFPYLMSDVVFRNVVDLLLMS